MICILFFVFAVPPVAAEIKIDADFPGSSIGASEIDGDTVRLKCRYDYGWMVYWSFRIRGAEGRTLNFELFSPRGKTPSSNGGLSMLTTRGPAISNDNGVTWRWLSDTAGFLPETSFQYTFGPDEKDVIISSHMNYTERDLKRFLEKFQGNANLKIETLCQSPQGRKVELIRMPQRADNADADFKIYLSARAHSGETPTSWILEGIIGTVLSDSDDGKWLREHCDFFIVPFVDKDGVETGELGNGRKPHNHNRDFLAKVHPETRAITEQVPRWQNGKPIIWIDMHATELRGRKDVHRPEYILGETFQFVGSRIEEFWKQEQRFGKILEAEKKGPIPYKEEFNAPFGKSWNRAAHFDGEGLCHSSRWAELTLSNVVLVSTSEINYANAWPGDVRIDADSLRLLGRDLARAFRVYLETLEK